MTRARDGRRAAVRDRLLVAAEQLLAAGESYPAVSVERLSREARLTRTTFYVYFEDKADLLHAWLEQIDTGIEAAAARWWALESPGREELRAVLAALLATYRAHAHLMSAVYDAALFDRALELGLREIVARTAGGLRAHIEDGQRAGWVDPRLPAAETASWLAWLIQRGQQRLRGADDAELGREVAAYTTIMWNTLYAPAR